MKSNKKPKFSVGEVVFAKDLGIYVKLKEVLEDGTAGRRTAVFDRWTGSEFRATEELQSALRPLTAREKKMGVSASERRSIRALKEPK